MKQLYRGKASLLYKATCRHSNTTVALKLYRKHKLSSLNWYQVTFRTPSGHTCLHVLDIASVSPPELASMRFMYS
jgi:hypothetical protein